jgi:hypothetical protein
MDKMTDAAAAACREIREIQLGALAKLGLKL